MLNVVVTTLAWMALLAVGVGFWVVLLWGIPKLVP